MEIMVSINCITYNHEKYIGNAIESFLMQKTQFKYEILIGEDCSTDNTRSVIEGYIQKYPDIIRMVTSECNVGSRKNVYRLHSNSVGKYVAICEGDDYWTDPDKLQKQISFMESHPDCSMCYHAAEILDVISNKSVGYLRPYKKSVILPADRPYLGGGDYCPTASIVYVKKHLDNIPKFFFESPVGDHPIALILSSKGRIAYIDEVMSVRSLWVPGSWNTNHHELSIRQQNLHKEKLIKVLDDFNSYSNGRFDKDISKFKLDLKVEILRGECIENPLETPECKALIKRMRMSVQLKIMLRQKLPFLFKTLDKFRHYV